MRLEPIVKQFYQYLKTGKIMGLKCDLCGFVLLPPRGICPRCGGFGLSWAELSGKGKLLFASVGVHKLMEVEFIQGTIKLEEGPTIPGRVFIDDFDFLRPEKILNYIRINIPVQAEIIKNPAGIECIAFKIIR